MQSPDPKQQTYETVARAKYVSHASTLTQKICYLSDYLTLGHTIEIKDGNQ
jgi:hypothetical protein